MAWSGKYRFDWQDSSHMKHLDGKLVSIQYSPFKVLRDFLITESLFVILEIFRILIHPD